MPLPENNGTGMDGDYPVLFMTIFQWEPGKTDEIMQVRMKESIPSGIRVISEWVALDTNTVFRLEEIEDPVALLKHGSMWSDLGYTEMHPVMESAEALRLLG